MENSHINLEQLTQLMFGVLDHTTAYQCNTQIEQLLRKQPSVMLPLLLQITSNFNTGPIRQMSALFLRRRIFNGWARLPEDTQETFKKALLEILLKEPESVTRKTIAEVIAVIGRVTIPNQEWNELLQFLSQISEAAEPAHREVSMFLFDKLVFNIGDNLRPHFSVLHQIFLRGLQDENNQVRIAAVAAVGSLVGWFEGEKEVQVFQDMIPLICQVVEYCIVNNHTAEAISAFETFADIVELPKKELAVCIPPLAKWTLTVIQKEIDYDVKRAALTFLEWVIKFKPKSFYRNDLVRPLLQVILPMCSQINESPDEDDDDDEDDDEEEKSPEKIASLIIRQASFKVPEKFMLEDTLNWVKFYTTSQNSKERVGAISVLGSMCEGYQQTFRNPDYLPNLLEFLYSGCTDTDTSVRQISALSLAKFAKFLRPEIFEHYEKIIPVLFQTLEDNSNEAKVGALFALESFCQELGEKILPYLNQLVQKITQLCMSDILDIQEVALSALSATAASSESHFLPFANNTLELMRNFILLSTKYDYSSWETAKAKEQLSPALAREMTRALVLRGRATEVVGLVAQAIGKENFAPVCIEFMEMVFNGFAMNVGSLKEYGYNFFAAIATVLKEDFAPFAPKVMELILNEIADDSGVEDLESSNRIVEADEEEEPDEGKYNYVRDGFLEDKVAATRALGLLAEEMGAHFKPFLDASAKVLMLRVSHFDQDVQSQAVLSFAQVLSAVNQVHPSQPWKRGETNVIDKDASVYLAVTIPVFIGLISGETEPEIVSDTFDSLAKVIKIFGAGAIESYLPRILELITTTLMRTLPCFSVHEDYDDDDDEESPIQALMETACDCLSQICDVYGEKSMIFFPKIMPIVMKFTKKSECHFLRSLAVGTLAECCLAIGPASSTLTQELLNCALGALNESSQEIKGNGAWFLGVILENAGKNGHQYYLPALKALSPLFSNTSRSTTMDNACGCVARMIITGAEALPLSQVLPVFLTHLPLKEDMNENKVVFRCLFGLLSAPEAPEIAAHLPEFFRVFAQSVQNLTPELKQELQSHIVTFGQAHPQEAQKLIQGLNSEDQSALSQVMNQNANQN